MKGLDDRVVLVTGGAGAIGRAICRRFVEAGSDVAVLDLDGDAASAWADELAGEGARTMAVGCDITRRDDVEAAVSRAEQELGPVDVLVNNAGWDRIRPFLETDPELWDRIIGVNLHGPLFMHHAVVRRMTERGKGAVVSIASDAGRVGSSGEAVYAACKGGIIAFTKSLAREVTRHGVRLNCVCPGPTDTPLLQSLLEEGETGRKIYEGLKRAIPMRRLGQPEDIAGIVAFLASDEAAFMTGQVISVSGGLTMHG